MYVWDAESTIAQGGTTTYCPLEETSCCCNRLAQHHNPITRRYKNAPAPHFAQGFWFLKKVQNHNKAGRLSGFHKKVLQSGNFSCSCTSRNPTLFIEANSTHGCLVKHLLQVIIYFSSHVPFQYNPPCCAVLHFMTHLHNIIGDGGCRMQRTK